MSTLEKTLKETLKSVGHDLKNDPILKDYIQANEDFNKMVEQGIAVRRGYNLRATGDNLLSARTFNIKK